VPATVNVSSRVFAHGALGGPAHVPVPVPNGHGRKGHPANGHPANGHPANGHAGNGKGVGWPGANSRAEAELDPAAEHQD
jgi:hypothetical protein